MLLAAGFTSVSIDLKPDSREVIKNWMPGSGAEDFVCSADITAYKPSDGKVGQPEKIVPKEELSADDCCTIDSKGKKS